MPYISQKERQELKAGRPAETVGEVNYLISCKFNEIWKTDPSYNTINEIENITLRFDVLEGHIILCRTFCNHSVFTNAGSYLLHPLCFSDLDAALRCAKREFYRRIAVPYEEQKLKENGDVYT